MFALTLLKLSFLSLLIFIHATSAFISPSLLRRRSPDSPSEHFAPFFQQDLNVNPIVRTKDTAINAKCAPWYPIRDYILRNVFAGRCSPHARAAVRLAFHDAGTFSLARESQGLSNGGADGSLLTDPSEVQRADNNGLQSIVAALTPLPAKFNVSAADILQVAGTLGVIVCPGGPIVRTYIGRRNAANPAPDGLLPDTHADVPKLLARFADMGFSVRDTMALMGAHSTAIQQFVTQQDSGKSLDSTPEIWDVDFYAETINNTSPSSLPSDKAFSSHNSTQRAWKRYVRDQDDWDEDYAKAHRKMSILGQSMTGLTECTEILPPKIDLGSLGQNEGGEGMGEVDLGRLEKVVRLFRAWWLNDEDAAAGGSRKKAVDVESSKEGEEGIDRKRVRRRRRRDVHHGGVHHSHGHGYHHDHHSHHGHGYGYGARTTGPAVRRKEGMLVVGRSY